MKLIFCQNCYDIVKLVPDETRYCICGKSSGRYIDAINAEYSGEALPLGIENKTFGFAVKNQPKFDNGRGVEFTAFVIAEICDTFKRAR